MNVLEKILAIATSVASFIGLLSSTILFVYRKIVKCDIEDYDARLSSLRSSFLYQKHLADLREVLPSFVSAAESRFGQGNGDLKKDFVSVALSLYLSRTAADLTDLQRSQLLMLGEDFVESVLEAPEKKV